MFEGIRQLIAADKLERALEDLKPYTHEDEERANDLIKYQADLAKNKKDSRRGLITIDEENKTRTRVRYAILEMLNEITPIAPAADSSIENSAASEASTAFISYNHADSDAADKLKVALEESGIVVRIDTAAMEAGANIQEFIERSIRETGVTISIVSNRSLLSAWVALESIDSFYQEKFTGRKRFIACYLDDDFFRNDFQLKAIRQIDLQIEEIDRLLPDYNAQRIDTSDLNSQKTRLYDLRNNLGHILLRLRESLCLDIRDDKFDQSVAKIVSAIRNV
ncbi:MAG TPA: TIR domain-containing protein [Blastocatellia bacterium]|nr:TIR domain-containing protein [Blastocatellia bacterium]